jgi:hypothetical protein
MNITQNYNEEGIHIKMYDFQRAIQIKSGRDTLICNWARGLGKTFTMMSTILEERPYSVLYFRFQNDGLKTLNDKYREITKMFDNVKSCIKEYNYSKEKIEIVYSNNQRTTIYNWYMLPIEYGVRQFDYIIYDDLLPSPLKDIYTNKTLSFVTINNYDNHLEKMFGDKTVIVLNEDYSTGLNCELFSEVVIEKIKEDYSKTNIWFNDFDLLSKPIENKKEVINLSTNRKYELYQSYAIDNPSKRFIIDSLIGLEEEYDNIDKTKDTVLTRKNLLDMIIQLTKELER